MEEEPRGIFVSTQIQSRLEDIEEESKYGGMFSQFSNHLPFTEVVVNKLRRSKTDIEDAKKKCNKLSVSDLMVRKISGKPSKIKKKSAKIKEPNETNEILYDVFNEEEWKKVDYRLLTFKNNSDVNIDIDGIGDHDHDSLWSRANTADDDNLQMLVDGERSKKILQIVEFEPPVTLSQLMRDEAPQRVLVQNSQESKRSQESQISQDVVELVEVSCSSDIGSPLCGFELDSKEEQRRSVTVYGHGLNLSINCCHDIRLVRNATNRELEEYVSDSEDEDDSNHSSYSVQIKSVCRSLLREL